MSGHVDDVLTEKSQLVCLTSMFWAAKKAVYWTMLLYSPVGVEGGGRFGVGSMCQ